MVWSCEWKMIITWINCLFTTFRSFLAWSNRYQCWKNILNPVQLLFLFVSWTMMANSKLLVIIHCMVLIRMVRIRMILPIFKWSNQIFYIKTLIICFRFISKFYIQFVYSSIFIPQIKFQSYSKNISEWKIQTKFKVRRTLAEEEEEEENTDSHRFLLSFTSLRFIHSNIEFFDWIMLFLFTGQPSGVSARCD